MSYTTKQKIILERALRVIEMLEKCDYRISDAQEYLDRIDIVRFPWQQYTKVHYIKSIKKYSRIKTYLTSRYADIIVNLTSEAMERTLSVCDILEEHSLVMVNGLS